MIVSCVRTLCSVFLLTAISGNPLFLASIVDFQNSIPVEAEPVPELVQFIEIDEPASVVQVAADIPEIEFVGPSADSNFAPRPAEAKAQGPSRRITGTKRSYDARRRLRITAYCDRGTTAAGIPSGVGQCAAPADIPFGSKIYIPALDRTFIVTDRTHERFRTTTVDLFIPDRDRCLEFGRRYLDVEITLPDRKHRYGSPEIYKAIASRNH